NEGVFNGDPSWASVNGCKVGQCLDFDGSGDYISVQHSGGFFSDMNKISISFWAKWDSFNSWSRIIDFGSSGGSNGAVLVANESGGNDFIFEIRDSSGSSLGKCEVVDGIKKDEWIYWVAVWTEGEQKVYKDGTLVKTCNFAGSWSSISEPNKWFGKSNWSGDDFYNGKIDEMRIYNKALSSSTIKEIYNTTK
ncbi:MAG: LamG domain-containing protein, partial [Candidatus Magasanikbacteria bacterium]